jgi:putative (di)nucleoside polyphosphate hydrolase
VSTDHRPSVSGSTHTDRIHVPKVCAYVTRRGRELLVFESDEHDGLQVPKGTVEPAESLRAALGREVREESGLGVLGPKAHLATDVWTRRPSPLRRYVRHFFHVPTYEPRDRWTHTVTDGGDEHGLEFEFSWITLPTEREFALALDDYLPLLEQHLWRG